MPGRERKQMLTSLEAASEAEFGDTGEPLLCTQGVRGSNPLVSTRYPPRQMQVLSP